MLAADIPAGLHLCRLSRWNQLEDDWRVFLDSPGNGGRLAEADGAPVGSVAFLRYDRCFSWLSMMLVDPDARRGGIGTRLMEAALEALAGESCVRLDATPLGEPLYRRFGFDGEYELIRMTATVASGGRLQNARPMTADDLPIVFARDLEVFGADRSALLASLFRRAPDLAWVAPGGATLRGYCFGRPGFRYPQLGPVVADAAEAASALAAGALAAHQGEQVAIDVPRLSATEWTAWLASAGFAVERPFLRMCRGRNACPGLPDRQFAIAGPEFG
jgi:GNAT superfamily N-acetyltransferase